MDAQSIRETLIAQHKQLRVQIAALMDVTQPPNADDPAGELDFRVRLVELSDALAQHNRDEERLLSTLAPAAATGAPARLMSLHHQREHVAQLGALKSVVDCKSFGSAIVLVQGSLRTILDHMAGEERELGSGLLPVATYPVGDDA